MKFTITSDLHLEFYNTEYAIKIADKINAINADVNIVAGDIDSRKLMFDYTVEKLIDNCFYVKGNHDYYKQQINNDVYRLNKDGVSILGCTLWTSFDNGNPFVKRAFQTNMADNSYIHKIGYSLIEDIEKINEQNFQLILDEQPDIVVTHHCPTLRSIHEKFKMDRDMNFCFSNDYEKHLYDTKIKYWCFGHTHHRHNYTIGNTQFICNPAGYPGEIKEEYNPIVIEL